MKDKKVLLILIIAVIIVIIGIIILNKKGNSKSSNEFTSNINYNEENQVYTFEKPNGEIIESNEKSDLKIYEDNPNYEIDPKY